MIKKFMWLLALVLLILVIFLVIGKINQHKPEKKIMYYRNPMDSTIHSPVFKKDEMGMDYIPVYEVPKETQIKGIALGEDNKALMAIKTVVVHKVQMTNSFTAVGSVAYDPDLYLAQEEYLQAVKAGSNQAHNQEAAQIQRAARQKLLLAGMTNEQINDLSKDGQAQKNLFLPKGKDAVWIYFNVFEKDMNLIKSGQAVTIESASSPGRKFVGIVRGLTPVIDADTRSLKARASVNDAVAYLKPGMYITAKVTVSGSVVLAVPEDAVIETGIRTLVYVEVEKGQYVAKNIVAGRQFNGNIEIISGLEAGDKVVAEGSFFIDSESKIQGK